jgi:hypothetical protein
MRVTPFVHHHHIAAVGLVVALVALAACSSARNAQPTATTAPGSPTTTAPSASGPTTSAPVSTAATSTTTVPPTTVPPTTTLPIVTAPGKLKVANASGINGAAGRISLELAARGFTLTNATNAFGPDKDLKVTKIYVSKGSEKVADSVSRLMGGVKVYPMPIPAWIEGGTAALEGATVLVMLGADKADKHLSAMAG